jgi:hypothetical protein
MWVPVSETETRRKKYRCKICGSEQVLNVVKEPEIRKQHKGPRGMRIAVECANGHVRRVGWPDSRKK